LLTSATGVVALMVFMTVMAPVTLVEDVVGVVHLVV